MATLTQQPHGKAGPTFSLVSILSIIAALVSFQFGFTLGLVLAIAAIIMGAIGALAALLPGTRGGMLSIVAIVAGAIGVIAAVFRLFGGDLL